MGVFFFAKYGLFGGFILLYIIPAILVNIACIRAMKDQEKSLWIVLCSFIFGFIISGVFYVIWYNDDSSGLTVSEQTTQKGLKKIWICSACGRTVRSASNCLCGHKYDATVDKGRKVKLFRTNRKRQFCPKCGTANRNTAFVCIRCGQSLGGSPFNI